MLKPGGRFASNLTAEARHFLEEPRFAVIATINADGSPHQTVVWYLLRSDLTNPRTKTEGRHRSCGWCGPLTLTLTYEGFPAGASPYTWPW